MKCIHIFFPALLIVVGCKGDVSVRTNDEIGISSRQTVERFLIGERSSSFDDTLYVSSDRLSLAVNVKLDIEEGNASVYAIGPTGMRHHVGSVTSPSDTLIHWSTENDVVRDSLVGEWILRIETKDAEGSFKSEFSALTR